MSTESGRDRTTIVIGAILALVGVLFLAGQLTGIAIGRIGWPLFIILPGLFFFVVCPRRVKEFPQYLVVIFVLQAGNL